MNFQKIQDIAVFYKSDFLKLIEYSETIGSSQEIHNYRKLRLESLRPMFMLGFTDAIALG